MNSKFSLDIVYYFDYIWVKNWKYLGKLSGRAQILNPDIYQQSNFSGGKIYGIRIHKFEGCHLLSPF